jgi:ABC-type sugar transport system permease subunit
MKTGTRVNIIGYALIGPWIFGVMIFQMWPILNSLLMSFMNYNILAPPVFAGLDNYREMFADKTFVKSVRVTFAYVLGAVPAKIIFALFVAMVMNLRLKGINFFRTVYYIPSIFGASIAVAILWKALFVKDGIINMMLKNIGITGPAWLGDPKYVLFTFVLLTVWQFGSSMVVFLAGLKQIPASLYEAAEVDGANKISCFFHITIPGIMPMMWFNVLMQTISAFQVFATPYTVFNGTGGPINSAMLYVIYLYQNAFKFFRMGYASTLSWTLLLLIAGTSGILALIQRKFFNYD